MMDIKKIGKLDWVKRWAGSYTLISCSFWGKQYKKALEKNLGVGFDHALFIHKSGTVSFYVLRNEIDNFGRILSQRASDNMKLAREWCQKLKNSTDKMNKIMKKIGTNTPTNKMYKEFAKVFFDHLAYHNSIKKTIDYLTLNVLKELSSDFKDARLYSEKVYSETESFFRNIMKTIAKKEGYNADNLTCMTQDEFENYLGSKKLPDEKILKDRFKLSALYFVDAKENILVGKEVKNLESQMLAAGSIGRIKGSSVFPGKVMGVARVVSDPHKVGVFNKGDVLVTGMTRPEFLPIMKKAGAIVTDAGGLLCHAAISARELRKPCIVGAQTATMRVKDGQKIFVDADIGIVKLII